jgi:hypothetical protein
MQDFSDSAEIEGRRLQFAFRQIFSSDQEKYFVTASAGEKTVAEFEMVTDEQHRWRILDPVPPWVRIHESLLLGMTERHHMRTQTHATDYRVLRREATDDGSPPPRHETEADRSP